MASNRLDIRWSPASIASQQEKVAIVTGSNRGIGYEVARALAAKHATVVMAVRNLERGEAARAKILRRHPAARLEVMPLDLADLASVHAFAAAFRSRHDRLSLLINNAGVLALPFMRTVDGFEMQFGTNHLGHFALTGLLLPLLLATPGARVVGVSSNMHETATLDFRDVHEPARYNKWNAYCQSKLAIVLFGYELQRRLSASGADVCSIPCHPGTVATRIGTIGPQLERSWLRYWFFFVGMHVGGQAAHKGAWAPLCAGLHEGLRGGEFVGPLGRGLTGRRGRPGVQASSPASLDRELAQEVWHLSEAWTGVRFEFPQKRADDE